MDLRARSKLQSKLNEKDWMINIHKKRKSLKNAVNNGPTKKILQESIIQDLPLKNKNLFEKKVDTFCWICHTFCQDKVCSQCPRIYHLTCLKGFYSFDAGDVCPECQLFSVGSEDECSVYTCSRLKELMMYALDRVFAEKRKIKDIFFKWPKGVENTKLYQIMDAEALCKNLNADLYENTKEFYSDFKWLYHNCFIAYGGKSENTIAAEQLTKKLQEELISLEACTDCYFFKNSNEVTEQDFFTRPCTKPHEIVMAKVKGFTYWPAKCLKVTKNGSAQVVFFGTHEMSSIPANMWFSLKCQSTKSIQQQYAAAVKELLKYSDNLKVQSGKQNVEKTYVSEETQTSLLDSCEESTNFETASIPEISSVITINKLFDDIDSQNDGNEDMDILNTPQINSEIIDNQADSLSLLTSETVSVSMTFSEDTSALDSNDIYLKELLSLSNNLPLKHTRVESKSEPFISSTLRTNRLSSDSDCCRNAWLNEQQNYSTEFVTSTPVLMGKSQPSFISSKLENAMIDKIENCELFDIKDSKINSTDFKKCEPSKLNLDTTAMTKFIFTQDPEFALLFQEKSKQFFDSLMIQSWTKLRESQISPAAISNLLEETKAVKEQVIEQRKKLQTLIEEKIELKNQLNSADAVIKGLEQNFRNQIKEITEEKDKTLQEMKNEMERIFKDKSEITKKYEELKITSINISTEKR